MRTMDVYRRNPDTGSYDSRLVVKLICNYRSHPDILHVPNELFYMNELQYCADDLRNSFCHWDGLIRNGFPMIFHGVVGKDEREERSPSFFNVDEIAVVKEYLSKLLTSKIKLKQNQIGIIAPYRRQVCSSYENSLNLFSYCFLFHSSAL